MSLEQLLPGKSEYEISRLTKLHQLNMRITDGNAWVARSFGSMLLVHMTSTMRQLMSLLRLICHCIGKFS